MQILAGSRQVKNERVVRREVNRMKYLKHFFPFLFIILHFQNNR